jgi:hypothetical protein
MKKLCVVGEQLSGNCVLYAIVLKTIYHLSKIYQAQDFVRIIIMNMFRVHKLLI